MIMKYRIRLSSMQIKLLWLYVNYEMEIQAHRTEREHGHRV